MSRSLLKILAEDSALAPVAKANQQSWLWLATVMIGATICVPIFQFGAMLGNQMAFWPMVLGVSLGGFIAGIMAIITGIVGQRTGLTSSLIIRQTFGQQGFMVLNTTFIAACIGWFGIQTDVFASAFVQTTASLWGLNLPFAPVAFISGLLMTTTAVIGFRGIGKLSYIAVPLLLVLLASPLVMLLMQDGAQALWLKQAVVTAPSVGTVAAMAAGAYIAALIPDLSRFMKTERDVVKGIVINHMLAYPILLTLTGALAILSGGNDVMVIMLAFNFGVLALVVLFLATWSTNDTNIYSGALTLNPFLPQVPRWQLTLAAGTLGSVAAAFGIFEHFMTWLILLGVMFSPIAAVMTADYFTQPQHYAKGQLGKIKGLRSEPFAACVLGILVGYCATPATEMGGGLFQLSGIVVVDSFLASLLAYWFFTQSIKWKV